MEEKTLNRKTVIVFQHIGPYHVARINSLAARFNGLLAVELASRVNARCWERPGATDFELITLVDDTYENIPPKTFAGLLEDVLIKTQPKCVITCGYSHPAMRTAAKWAKKQPGTATVLLSESQQIDHKRNALKEYLKSAWINKFFDAAFVGGASAASYLQSLGFPRERIWRGYNAVDNEYFGSGARSIRTDADAVRKRLKLPDRFFLYVGRFSEEKNLLRLLKGYRQYLSDTGKGAWGLVMVGSGPQEDTLREEAGLLGLKDICWPGFVQIDDLPGYYALASGFILPSITEPWGLVVNEAMASGLPVLVSHNCGCAPDLVAQGVNGRLFDPYSETGIAAAMKWLTSKEANLQAMQEASRLIVANYSTRHWAIALEDCISEIMARNSA